MSTESETKSAGVPAGATHQCVKCKAFYRRNNIARSFRTFDYLSEKHCNPSCSVSDVLPIAEAGPAPTTAAPAEQYLASRGTGGGEWNTPDGREYLRTLREPAEQPGKAKKTPCDPREHCLGWSAHPPSEDCCPCHRGIAPEADDFGEPEGQPDPEVVDAVPCTKCGGWLLGAMPECGCPPEATAVPAEQPGKAADPRPAQPQAPAELGLEIEAAREFVANAAKWNEKGDPRAAKAGLALAEQALAKAAAALGAPEGQPRAEPMVLCDRSKTLHRLNSHEDSANGIGSDCLRPAAAVLCRNWSDAHKGPHLRGPMCADPRPTPAAPSEAPLDALREALIEIGTVFCRECLTALAEEEPTPPCSECAPQRAAFRTIRAAITALSAPPPPSREQELLGEKGGLLKLLAEARAYVGYGVTFEQNDLCERIDAALSAPPRKAPQEAWRPIESAPKDGAEVLLRVKYRAGIPGGVLVGHYMRGGHCIEDHPPFASGWYFWNGGMFDKAAEPTHWMPLPASSPEEQLSGKDLK